MKVVSLILKSGSAIALLSYGILIFNASLGRNQFGDPSAEILRQSCTISNSSIARLYEGAVTQPYKTDRGTAFVYWYSVTLQESEVPERQVFYTYGYPVISAIDCHDHSVAINSDKQRSRLAEFSIAELRELRNCPRGIYNGVPEQRSQKPSNISLIARQTFGSLCFLLSGLLLLSIVRQLMTHQ